MITLDYSNALKRFGVNKKMMKIFVLLVRDYDEVGFAVVETVVVDVVNNKPLGTVHDLSVHADIDYMTSVAFSIFYLTAVHLFSPDCVPAMLGLDRSPVVFSELLIVLTIDYRIVTPA